MNLSELFKILGAPLKQIGSVRDSDGVVFLRVWQDQQQKHDGARYMKVLSPDWQGEPGFNARGAHVQLIKQGSKSYMVMCQAGAEGRQVKDFDADRLFPGGRLLSQNGEEWLELLAPVARIKAMPPKPKLTA
jgi:hypothetical protein